MTRRLLPFFALAVVASGCLEVPTCVSNDQCPGGGTCDTRYGLCVYGADAGGGGGSGADDAGTGGGGGADDAGTGGGGGADDAGTGGGGGADDAGTGGDGGAEDAGTGGDGGADDAGADAGAPDAGVPDAGTPDAGTPDAGPVCNPNKCSEWEACHPTLNVCVQVSRVLITSPPNAGTFGGPTMNPLRIAASVVAMDGGPAPSLPMSLALTLIGPDGGGMTLPRLADGGYALLHTFPPVEASYTARVGWPDGPDASVTFSVDFLAPMQSYVEPPSPPSGFKRDMLRPLLVRTHEAATVSATLQGTSGVASLTTGTNFCANRGLTPAPNDLCVRLDFSAPDFDAVSGVMTLQTFATDTWGNQSMFAASYLVDRVRWRYAPNPTVLVNSTVAPALDSDGNLYLGYNVGAGGGVVSLDADGGARLSVALGSIQGIAVGPRQVSGRSFDQVFVTYNENASGGPPVGYVGAFHANGSAVGLASPQTSGAGQPTWSAPGLYDAGLSMSGNVEIGAAAILSTAQGLFGTEVLGQLCVYFPNGGGVCDDASTKYAQPEPALTGPLFSPLNLAIAGNTAYFQNTEPTLTWRILAAPNQKPGVGGSTPALGGFPTGLALSSAAVASATISNGASLRTYDRSGPAAALAEQQGPAGAMAPALAGGNTVSAFLGGGTGASWLRLSQFSDSSYPAFLGNAVSVGAPSTGALTTSPVVGDRGFLYAVTHGGELRVYDANPGAFGMAAPKWSMTVFPGDPSPVVAHPNLDCNRRESGQPGTLYVVNRSGAVAAIIVDSRRLAVNSHWPRWQRTAGNAGNVDFPLNPGCP